MLHADQPDKPIKIGPHDDVRHVAVSPDGRWVATGRWSYPGGAKIWELTPIAEPSTKGLTYKLVKELPSGGGTEPVFSPDGKWLLTSDAAAIRPIHRWEVGTWIETPFQEPIEGLSAAYSPDSKLVVVETGAGVARLIDAVTAREYARLEDPSQDRGGGFVFTSDGAETGVRGRWLLRAHLGHAGNPPETRGDGAGLGIGAVSWPLRAQPLTPARIHSDAPSCGVRPCEANAAAIDTKKVSDVTDFMDNDLNAIPTLAQCHVRGIHTGLKILWGEIVTSRIAWPRDI